MIRVLVAIDPGLSGAIAVLGYNNGKLLGVFDTPIVQVKRGKKNSRVCLTTGMANLLRRIIRKYCSPFHGLQSVLVCIEYLHSRPFKSGVAMFSIGRSFGQWEGIVSALGLPIEYVTPAVWKKAMLTTGTGNGKEASVVKVQQLFPGAADKVYLKKHDGRADAILIGEYIRQRRLAIHGSSK